jgi:hypothetical protein
LGDALHALSCAAGYNIRWLLRAITAKAAKDAKAFFFSLSKLNLWGRIGANGPCNAVKFVVRSLAVGWRRLVAMKIDCLAPLASVRAG